MARARRCAVALRAGQVRLGASASQVRRGLRAVARLAHRGDVVVHVGPAAVEGQRVVDLNEGGGGESATPDAGDTPLGLDLSAEASRCPVAVALVEPDPAPGAGPPVLGAAPRGFARSAP